MKIKSAEFVISNTDINKCPKPNMPEYAFIGRSNVGKSSLINMLVGKKDLAKTSGKPGKTQLINHFLINEKLYIVDLPGYGFAKVSKELKYGFEKIITDYLLKRENLMCVFVLIDVRLSLQQIDKEFMIWLGDKEIPFVIAYTKADKLKRTELQKNIDNIENALLKWWEEIPQSFVTSAEARTGKEDILEFIGVTNKNFSR